MQAAKPAHFLKWDPNTDVFLWILRNFWCFPVNIAKFQKTPILKKSAYGCFWSDLRKWLFRAFFLVSRFQNHAGLVILQKYQPLSNHSFKHNLAYILFKFNAKLSFEPWFCMFIISGYGRKSKRLYSLDSLLDLTFIHS